MTANATPISTCPTKPLLYTGSPSHRDGCTPSDWFRRVRPCGPAPESRSRIFDGTLILRPSPVPRHQPINFTGAGLSPDNLSCLLENGRLNVDKTDTSTEPILRYRGEER